jgi:diguanylate cyclase (GGDEF)-like protein
VTFPEALRRIPAIRAAWLLPALACFAALGYSMFAVRAATAQIDRSDRVLLRANDLERKVVDLETGLRGYAITHDHLFLAPMLAAQKGIPGELDELEGLVRGDAAQGRRAERISNEVWSYARYWLLPALRLQEADSGLAAAMWTSIGRERMEAIRGRFAAFERAELARRAVHEQRVRTYEVAVVAIMFLLLLGSIAASFLAVRRLRGGVATRVGDLTAKLEASDARNDELLVELERRRQTDQLTGIANRAAFVERLDAECTAARRHCGDLSVLRVELQGLGELNDAHGYSAGNAVLLRAVALCTAQLRSGDVLGRIGGNELAILLPRTPARGAEMVADGLVRRIEAESVAAGPATIPLRVRVGAASAAHGADAETLLRDAALDLKARKAAAPQLAA